MKDERGEAILFCVLVLVALSGLLTLCGLKLQHSFRLMEKRTNLFLCVKEAKGELNNYMKSMGRLNWLLKNVTKAQKIALFFPPLWPYVGNAEKLKRAAKSLQATSLAVYGTKLTKLKIIGCPLDPQMVLNPYRLGSDFGFQRKLGGEAILRSKKWTYYFLERPYLVTLKISAERAESIMPKLAFQAEEKGAILSSLLSSR
jgi:hypothetical protein